MRKQMHLKLIFLTKAMLEEDIATKAASLGVTRGLDRNVTGYLPVHCINQLLISRIFSRNQINIQDWIRGQVLECRVPIHYQMVQMLENFALSCFPTTEDSNFNTKIEESFFWVSARLLFSLPQQVYKAELFSNDQLLAAQVLCLFYLLAYTRKLDTSVVSGLGKDAPSAYSDALWAEVPIRYILSTMDARPDDFELVRPSLLSYVGLSMPHMLPTLDASLDRTEEELAQRRSNLPLRVVPLRMFAAALDNIRSDLPTFTRLVAELQTASIQEQYKHYATVIRVGEALTSASCPCRPWKCRWTGCCAR